jgi:Phytanoyl-CoA dioxygenase (PhyH)
MTLEGLNRNASSFHELGYVVAPDVLTRDEANEVYEAFGGLSMVGADSEIIGWRSEAAERVLVADDRFLDVALNPKFVECARAVIGDDIQLIDYVAMEIGVRSGRERAWHVDFPLFTYPVCLSAIAAIYLTDMTEELGALYVVPGSHLWRRLPEADEKASPVPGEVKVAVPAGSAVVFNAQLWHTGTRNVSGRPRRALFLNYAHYWMKRMDEFCVTPLPDSIAESADTLVRQLFGLELVAESIWGADYTRKRERIRV